MTRPTILTLALLGVLLSAACQGEGSVTACTTQVVPGLRVLVADASTGRGIQGALVVAREGAYVDSARTPSGGLPVLLAYERAGVYQVTVEAEGFLPFGPVTTEVQADLCHVGTEDVVAALTPQG